MKSLSVRHFIPLCFVLSVLLPLIVGLFWRPALLVAALSLACYLLVLGGVSLRLAMSKRLNFFYLLSSFVVLHISYGWGSLIGILQLPFIKR